MRFDGAPELKFRFFVNIRILRLFGCCDVDIESKKQILRGLLHLIRYEFSSAYILCVIVVFHTWGWANCECYMLLSTRNAYLMRKMQFNEK